MRKIFTLLATFCFVIAGWAQTATLIEGYGEPLTLDQFKALAGTGQRFGFVASSNTAADNAPRCDHWVRWTSSHTGDLDDTALFYLEASGSIYLVKRASDNQYVITSTSSTSFGASGTAFKLVNRNPNDATAAVWGSQSISFEDPSNASNHYNANAVKYNGGAGAWTTYAVFGPIYKNITIDCQENGVSMSGYPQVSNYKIGGDVSAPAFPGKKQVAGDPTSVTVDKDNMVITFNYETSTYDYTLVVNGAVSGMTMTIKGEDIAYGATSYSNASEVVASDVVVSFPTGYEYMTANVTVSGTTITVNCEDTRWPINFSKDQKYTRTNRFINNVRIGSKTFSITNDGLNTPAYRDFTSDVLTVPAGATLVPAIGYEGEWMQDHQHGKGTFYFNNNNKYDGLWYRDDREGHGIMYYYNGDVYNGTWKQDKRHGKGRYTYQNGAYYDGEWRDDKKNGRGLFDWADGSSYEGQFVNDQKQGKGLYRYANGDAYIGQFAGDVQNGKGIYKFQNGDMYDGDYVNGERTGQGIFRYANGDRYTGQFLQGIKQGQGTLVWKNGNTYQGEWKQDKPNGRGKLTMKNGDLYEGQFLNGQIHGEGIARYADGSKSRGHFKQGKRHGPAIEEDKDGKRFEGSYVDDRRDGRFVEKDRNGNITAQGTYIRGRRQLEGN